MKKWDEQIIKEALNFAARWGFLTRDLFFEFMCPRSRARQFFNWSHLIEEGLFIRSQSNSQVLILTKKGRAQVGEHSRQARQSLYIEHDAIVARVFLSLQKRDLIIASWLEDELMRNPIEAYSVLGTDNLPRVPDVVMDLKTRDGSVRCALEIEKTRKSESRYRKLALAYLGYSRIGFILVGCGSSEIEMAIQRAFDGRPFSERKLVPGVFQYDEFNPSDLKTQICFLKRELSMRDFFQMATKREIGQLDLLRDRNETRVSLKNAKIQEAA